MMHEIQIYMQDLDYNSVLSAEDPVRAFTKVLLSRLQLMKDQVTVLLQGKELLISERYQFES